jgi:molecular chaperone GrpE (heat shock protein)
MNVLEMIAVGLGFIASTITIKLYLDSRIDKLGKRIDELQNELKKQFSLKEDLCKLQRDIELLRQDTSNDIGALSMKCVETIQALSKR